MENPPAMQEEQKMQVPSPGREDPLEEEMATHPSHKAQHPRPAAILRSLSLRNHIG